ncbi:cytochrome c3 family protein [Acuticoccus mangrovi]|uniref:Tetratricopeptide repeat protein n=1 Tax=Acuticoccus mangrovi TaxID=2796142 RepID=A0A934IKL8_9HYPH|nr:tetratricopeptide repeat protein [Acuticoccus mangrovi]
MAFLALVPSAFADEPPAYVGSETCAACHGDVVKAWQGSHHALAWTRPSPETVTADFDGTIFTHDGMTARFRIEADGSYHVAVTEKDGVTTDYRVHSVVGTAPLQQYLLETEPGRLQSFDVVWDTEKGGWFHLYPNLDLPPNDGMHWTGPYKNWNGRCAVCHSTGFEKNYDPQTHRFASREAEIGVGCEACHGPGEAHVQWAKGVPVPEGVDGFGFTQSFATPKETIEQCAGCHSRRSAYLEGSVLPGTPYDDAYNLSLLDPGLYHADGQVLDEVYVYGSFLQSKMYARGVTCLNCHDPHTATLRAPGNAVCVQCHNPVGNPAFPTLRPADYDSPAHHFHADGTAGAQCKNCHMTEHVYMGNDWRADHSFRIPRPDLDAITGAPDACTGCHTDRDPAWAAARIAEWYPDDRNRGPHYGTVLAHGRADPAAAAGDLAALVEGDAPGIVRATALSLLTGAGDPGVADRLAAYLADDDPLVRRAAVGVQRLAPPQNRMLRLLDSLEDPSRSVRMEAARALLDAPIAHLPGAIAEDLSRAMAEWRAALASNLDFPETHLQLGGMALVMRNAAAAEAAFREVVRLDPQRVDAWVMLARIAAAMAGPTKARAILEEAREHNPQDATITGLLNSL